MGLFTGLFKPKSETEKKVKKADRQLRQLKRSIEKNKKLLSTLEHEHHTDGANYTKQDCVAYAFLYIVGKQYDRDGMEFDINTAKWLLDSYCGGSDSYNGLFLLKFMMARSNDSKRL